MRGSVGLNRPDAALKRVAAGQGGRGRDQRIGRRPGGLGDKEDMIPRRDGGRAVSRPPTPEPTVHVDAIDLASTDAKAIEVVASSDVACPAAMSRKVFGVVVSFDSVRPAR